MSLISIDVDIAGTLQVIDKILRRRQSEHATAWKSLGDKLQAVSLTVGELDNMYYTVLAEMNDIFSQPKPDPKRIDDAVKQAQAYCTDTTLTFYLEEWRGEIQAAAFNHALKHHRYRELASTLRSIDGPLGRFINRLSSLQSPDTSDARERAAPIQAANTPKVSTDDRHWDLKTVLEVVKSAAEHPVGQGSESLPSLANACEEAIRNYDRALSPALALLIGHARQELAMVGL
jgi:hypothetical protein